MAIFLFPRVKAFNLRNRMQWDIFVEKVEKIAFPVMLSCATNSLSTLTTNKNIADSTEIPTYAVVTQMDVSTAALPL